MQLDQVENYCQGCVKYKAGTCEVFNTPYPLWGKGECWAREEDQEKWERTLQEIAEYGSPAVNRKKPTKEEDPRKADWEEVYYQEVHKPLAKPGGGGEKADRTNKTFGPESFKDNRFMHRKRNPKKYYNW